MTGSIVLMRFNRERDIPQNRPVSDNHTRFAEATLRGSGQIRHAGLACVRPSGR